MKTLIIFATYSFIWIGHTMLKKTTTLLVFLLLILGCKKDIKKTINPLPEKISEKKTKLNKAYHFFSTVEDLKILYQSDAWRMMLKDAKKIGLQNVQITQRDSSYFIHYSLINTKATIFNQQMDALPAFKNFREMSRSLTGTPLNYHKELTPVYNSPQNTSQSDQSHCIVLYHTIDNTSKSAFPLDIFKKKDALTKLENYLINNNIINLEVYHQNNRLYAIISSVSSDKLQEFKNKIRWDLIFDKEVLLHTQQQYPKFDSSHLLFKNWQEMTLL